MYKECCIHPHHAGFGMWEAGEYNGDSYELLSDLEQDMMNEAFVGVYDLDSKDLPESVEDIRGKIYKQPDKVYACVDSAGAVYYFGVSEFPDKEEA